MVHEESVLISTKRDGRKDVTTHLQPSLTLARQPAWRARRIRPW